MSTPNTEATGKPTPLAGCTIFLVILGMVTFMAIYAWYQYGEYKSVIVSISQEEQTLTHIAPTKDKALTQALETKMSEFGKAVKLGEKATISFTPAEINLAIAHYPKLEEFRGNMSIREISEKSIIADIAFEVNAGLSGSRYLNGEMVMEPVIAMGSIFPVVTEIKPDSGNPVPPKMTREFPTLLFTTIRNDEELAKVFHKLSTVELSDGLMTIVSDPAIKQPDALPDDVSFETNRALWLGGLLTFMFVTTVAFMVWYRKRKEKMST